jgi:hypothetical protein
MPAIIYFLSDIIDNTNTNNINQSVNIPLELIISIITFLSCIIFRKLFFNNDSFTISYFLLHFIVNFIITILCIPYLLTMFYDPNGINELYENQYITEYAHILYTYPILIGLHTYHLLDVSNINTSEIIHHIVTYIFYMISYKLNHPFYFVHLICMSGIPGGITYYMLFLEKLNIIKNINEKYISMHINFWIRCPGCIIYATLLYDRMIYMYEYIHLPHMFLILFIMLNGIYFTTTIVDSYYKKLYKFN